MLASSVRIALAKARTIDERSELAATLALAERLDDVESSFESRINASKAARGEPPTRLSKARRADLESLAEDEKTLHAQQLAELEALPSAVEVVQALYFGLQSDLSFWKLAPKRTHAADLPIVQEFIDAKSSLLDALARFLAARPSDDQPIA